MDVSGDRSWALGGLLKGSAKSLIKRYCVIFDIKLFTQQPPLLLLVYNVYNGYLSVILSAGDGAVQPD